MSVRQSGASIHLSSVEKGEVVQPHPDGGWPEFTITLRYFVTSDEPEAVQAAQQRVFEQDWRIDA